MQEQERKYIEDYNAEIYQLFADEVVKAYKDYTDLVK